MDVSRAEPGRSSGAEHPDDTDAGDVAGDELSADDTDTTWDDDEAVPARSGHGPVLSSSALAVAGLVLAALSIVSTDLGQLLLAAGRFTSFTTVAAIATGVHVVLAVVGGGLAMAALWIDEDSPRWVGIVARATVIIATVLVVIFAVTFTAAVMLHSPETAQAGHLNR